MTRPKDGLMQCCGLENNTVILEHPAGDPIDKQDLSKCLKKFLIRQSTRLECDGTRWGRESEGASYDVDYRDITAYL